ncbi:MAG TPA: DUF222 domain-containing protein [Mycobacteriales bacterium]|nr:DUF222 domain-containing protein [Mycobacteriales bacterium]
MSDIVTGAVEQVRSAFGSCAGVPMFGLANAQVDELLVQVFTQVSRFYGVLALPLIRQADARGLAMEQDSPSTRTWLRDHLRLRPAEAGRLLRLANELDRDLPVTAQALSDGRLSRGHAHAIAEAVRGLPAETPAGARVAAERELVEHSATFDPEEVVRLLGRRVLDVVNPDHADDLLRRRVEREAADAHARRGLRICPAGPGLRRVCGFLDTEGAETLRVALDPLARRPGERRAGRAHPWATPGRRAGRPR